jgi:hypothetical protein
VKKGGGPIAGHYKKAQYSNRRGFPHGGMEGVEPKAGTGLLGDEVYTIARLSGLDHQAKELFLVLFGL